MPIYPTEKSNRWRIVYDAPRHADGKRNQRWVTFEGSRRAAEKEERRLRSKVERGDYVEPAKATVEEFLEKWLTDCARPRLSGKAFERYSSVIRHHLIPAFGHLRLHQLRPEHVQAHVAAALASGRKDGREGGLRPVTVKAHLVILQSALDQAVKWRTITSNPARLVDPPRAVEPEMRSLTEAETARLLATMRGTRLFVPVLILVTTGLRRGELLALLWASVDLEARKISVTRSVEQTKAGGVCSKEPKTPRSRRTIDLPAIAADALIRHRAEQAARRLQMGPLYQDNGLVFPADDGTIWKPSALTQAFRKRVKRSGCKPIRLHDLRHTAATLMLARGENPKMVSEMLGHSSVAITLRIYSHVLPGMGQQAAERTDAALRKAMGDL